MSMESDDFWGMVLTVVQKITFLLKNKLNLFILFYFIFLNLN